MGDGAAVDRPMSEDKFLRLFAKLKLKEDGKFTDETAKTVHQALAPFTLNEFQEKLEKEEGQEAVSCGAGRRHGARGGTCAIADCGYQTDGSAELEPNVATSDSAQEQ